MVSQQIDFLGFLGSFRTRSATLTAADTTPSTLTETLQNSPEVYGIQKSNKVPAVANCWLVFLCRRPQGRCRPLRVGAGRAEGAPGGAAVRKLVPGGGRRRRRRRRGPVQQPVLRTARHGLPRHASGIRQGVRERMKRVDRNTGHETNWRTGVHESQDSSGTRVYITSIFRISA